VLAFPLLGAGVGRLKPHKKQTKTNNLTITQEAATIINNNWGKLYYNMWGGVD